MSRLTASRVAFDLIASFEGYRARAARAPDGQWTLGFGHTATAREGLTVTRNEAEDLLRWDLLPIEDTLRQVALMPLSQNQFDALVSFAFNIGLENFKTSDTLRSLNQGQPVAAAIAMHAWRRAHVNGQVLTIDALVRRRAAESALFLETSGARPAAPTSVIRPQIDYSAALLSHGVETSSVTTPLEGDIVPAPSAGSDRVSQGFPTETFYQDLDLPGPNATIVSDKKSQTETVLNPSTQAQLVNQDVLVGEVKQGVAADEVLEFGAQDRVDQDVSVERGHTDTTNPQHPVLQRGLSPFPGTPTYAPANGTDAQLALPANDSTQARLHASPELIDGQISSSDADLSQAGTEVTSSLPGKNSNLTPTILGLFALGALLLAGGLYYAGQSGIFSVQTPRVEPTDAQMFAVLAAASGFIILVTTVVAGLTRAPSEDVESVR